MSPKDGIGRKFTGEDLRSMTVRLRMEPKEVEELDDMAAQMQTTRSGVIREGLKLVKEKLSEKK